MGFGKGAVETVVVKGLNIISVPITIEGVTPLIMHAWSHKQMKAMLDKQMKKAAKGRDAKNPAQDFMDCLYFIGEKPKSPGELMENPESFQYGFPAVGFKAAAVSAATQLTGLTKVFLRGAFHIAGEFVEIHGIPSMREDMVRVGMGTSDIRHRAEFKEWTATLPVRMNGDTMSAEQLVNLFNQAGFSVGVGDWRPERDGTFGQFRVQTEE